ncbi:MAG: rhodanese-like domain-containing protein [Acidimicrobiia bacterium]
MAGVMEMVSNAKAGIENLTVEDVSRELNEDHAVLVDIREPQETDQGVIAGAVLAPRGMLEFYADPTTPYYMEIFSPDRRIILYCAAGSRSALAARTLQELGYRNVAHLDGGLKTWTEAGKSLQPAV